MAAMLPVMHKKGLHRRLITALMGNDPQLNSPLHLVNALVREAHSKDASRASCAAMVASLLPPSIHLFHGMADASVPVSMSRELADALRGLGLTQVHEAYYENKSHTDPILEDPISGRDILMQDLLCLVLKGKASARRGEGSEGVAEVGKEPNALYFPKLLPGVLLRLAKISNPF